MARDESEFHQKLQRFLVNGAISPSATRGNKKGVNKKVREFLYKISLQDFIDPKHFLESLNKHTLGLHHTQPGIPWGTARKCLNIFLREATFNVLAREHHRLAEIEGELEIPLDNFAATGIQRDAKELRMSRLP